VNGLSLHRAAGSRQDLHSRRQDPSPPICRPRNGGLDRRGACSSGTAKALDCLGSTRPPHRFEQVIDESLDPGGFDLCRRGRVGEQPCKLGGLHGEGVVSPRTSSQDFLSSWVELIGVSGPAGIMRRCPRDRQRRSIRGWLCRRAPSPHERSGGRLSSTRRAAGSRCLTSFAGRVPEHLNESSTGILLSSGARAIGRVTEWSAVQRKRYRRLRRAGLLLVLGGSDLALTLVS